MTFHKLLATAVITAGLSISAMAVQAAESIQDKTIGVIVMSMQSESLAEWTQQVTTAAAELGWTTVIKDGESNPAVVATKLPELLAQNVDAVITMAIDAPLFGSALADAKERGVPVIATSVGVAPVSAEQFTAIYSVDDAQLGAALAGWLKEKQPNSEAVGQTASVVYAADQLVVGAREALQGSSVTMDQTADVDVTNLVQSFTQTAIDLAQARPEATALISCCDFAPLMVLPALQSIGRGDMKLLTRLDNASSLQAMRSGAPLVVATFRPYYNLAALDALASHWANGTDIPATMPELTGDITVIDSETVPAEGRVYPFEAELESYAARWAETYSK